jgi:hypothetical protein
MPAWPAASQPYLTFITPRRRFQLLYSVGAHAAVGGWPHLGAPFGAAAVILLTLGLRE